MFARLSCSGYMELFLKNALASAGRWANPQDGERARNTVYLRTKAEFKASYQTRSVDSFPIAAAQCQYNITIELSVDRWEEIKGILSRKLVAVGASLPRMDRFTEWARAMLLHLAPSLPFFAFVPMLRLWLGG